MIQFDLIKEKVQVEIKHITTGMTELEIQIKIKNESKSDNAFTTLHKHFIFGCGIMVYDRTAYHDINTMVDIAISSIESEIGTKLDSNSVTLLTHIIYNIY